MFEQRVQAFQFCEDLDSVCFCATYPLQGVPDIAQFFSFLVEVFLALFQLRHRDVVRVHFPAWRKIFGRFLESLLKVGTDSGYGIVPFTKAAG